MSNPFYSTDSLTEKTIVPGITAKLVHLEGLTILHVIIEKGAVLPEHHHPHEQITNIIKGELEMTVGGETKVCKPGDVIAIGSNVPHSARAITECKVIDAFQPVREDYKAL